MVIIIFTPNKMMVMSYLENDAMTMNISPIRLIVGCEARLVRLAKSHRTAISGRTICSLQPRIIVYLAVNSFQLDLLSKLV